LVEHATENRSVGGSIPPLGTITPFHGVSQHRMTRKDALSAELVGLIEGGAPPQNERDPR
jgi:hypothetical protein